jgi:NAD(P)H-dependent FMN reductase
MINVGVILGSPQPERNGEAVAEWVLELAKQRKDAEFVLVDVKEIEKTNHWTQKIAQLDGFIFVTPEYNHGMSASLKSTLELLYSALNNKVAGFVGYGNSGALRAVEQLRIMMTQMQVTDVRAQVSLKLTDEIEDYKHFIPSSPHKQLLFDMIDQIVYWGEAMKKVRTNKALTA